MVICVSSGTILGLMGIGAGAYTIYKLMNREEDVADTINGDGGDSSSDDSKYGGYIDTDDDTDDDKEDGSNSDEEDYDSGDDSDKDDSGESGEEKNENPCEVSEGLINVNHSNNHQLNTVELVFLRYKTDDPLKGVEVHIKGNSVHGTSVDCTSTTDSSGKFIVKNVHNGTYDMDIKVDSDVYNKELTCPDDDGNTIKIKLEGEKYDGDLKVEYYLNYPFKHYDEISINVYGPLSSGDPYPVNKTKNLGQDQVVRFSNLPKGVYAAVARDRRIDNPGKRVNVPGSVVLQSGVMPATYTVVVKDTHGGSPIQGAKVSVNNNTNKGPQFEFTKTTDAQGKAVFDIVAYTSFDYKVSIEGEKIHDGYGTMIGPRLDRTRIVYADGSDPKLG